jgi:hypothetical protein
LFSAFNAAIETNACKVNAANEIKCCTKRSIGFFKRLELLRCFLGDSWRWLPGYDKEYEENKEEKEQLLVEDHA